MQLFARRRAPSGGACGFQRALDFGVIGPESADKEQRGDRRRAERESGVARERRLQLADGIAAERVIIRQRPVETLDRARRSGQTLDPGRRAAWRFRRRGSYARRSRGRNTTTRPRRARPQNLRPRRRLALRAVRGKPEPLVAVRNVDRFFQVPAGTYLNKRRLRRSVVERLHLAADALNRLGRGVAPRRIALALHALDRFAP